MATIECNEERLFRITLPQYVVIFASVLALVVRFSGSIVFSFVEVFQFIVLEFINDTPNLFGLIGQDVRDATIALGRLKRECQPVQVVLPGKQTLLMGIVASSAPSPYLNRMRNTTSVFQIAGDTPAATALAFLVSEEAAPADDLY